MFVLNEDNSVANHFLSEIRGVNTQKDRMRFRQNLVRLGEIMAYEISKDFDFKSQTISTPLGESSIKLIDKQPVLIAIMRAALPFFQGFLNYFDNATCGFVGSSRANEGSAEEIRISDDYSALPKVAGENVILIDPMIASGKSVVSTVQNILKKGRPNHIYITSVVASKPGIEYVKEKLNIGVSIWTCAVDDDLNNKAYIVPGLGDAGDLAFGLKN